MHSKLDKTPIPNNKAVLRDKNPSASSKAVLISGSIAFDFILLFDGKFKDHILPDRIHMLNVAFLTPQLQRQDGGCAANIAYTLAKLGGWARLLGSVGQDATDYLARLASYGIDLGSV